MANTTPTMTVDEDGDKIWQLNGKLHREDGPAVEKSDGSKEYWYLNGKLHREDGPAIESANGDKEWWLNGEDLSKEDFEERFASMDEDDGSLTMGR